MIRALLLLALALGLGLHLDPLGSGWERAGVALAVVVGYVALMVLAGRLARGRA